MLTPNSLLTKELKRLSDAYAAPVSITDGLDVDYRKVLRTIEFYLNSRYESGDADEYGEKPFMNVINANCDVSKVATDFDTKDIQAEADDGQQYDKSLVFRKEIYEWMKRSNFAKTLNDGNSVRVDYGISFWKRVEKVVDGKKELCIEIPEIQNLEFSPSDPLKYPIIESHYMSPSDFAGKRDSWKNVSEVLKEYRNAESTTDLLVKEINGEFPVSVYMDCMGKDWDDADEFIYRRYRFFIAEINNKQIYLHGDEQDQSPYKVLGWKKKAKRPHVGVAEEGIPAQIWINDTIQKEHKWFELASKWVGQTASRNLKGRNLMIETENGTILEHDDGKPVTRLDTVASAVPEFQNLIEKWTRQYDRESSITDAVRGENPPSGQAFRLQAMVQQQSNSTFNQRRQEMGIFIVEMFNDWILPHIAKMLDKAHILASDYSAEELKSLDENYANYNANQKVKELVLSGEVVSMEEYESFKQGYRDFIGQTKDKRFLDVPKGYYKDFKPKITIVTTGEQKNKVAVLETISNLLQLYLTNPMIFQTDPVASQMLSLALEKSGAGISPITLGLGQNKNAQQLTQQASVPDQPLQPQQPGVPPEVAALRPEAVQGE